jgi:hypothetical protein
VRLGIIPSGVVPASFCRTCSAPAILAIEVRSLSHPQPRSIIAPDS